MITVELYKYVESCERLTLCCRSGWCGCDWYAKMTLTFRLPVGPRGRRTSYWLLTLHSTLASSRVLLPPPPHPTPLPVPNFRSPTILLMGIPGSSRSRWAIHTCLSTSVHYPSYCSMPRGFTYLCTVYALLPRIPTSNGLFVCLSVASTISRQTASLSLEPVYWCLCLHTVREFKGINTRYSRKQLSAVDMTVKATNYCL